MNQPTPPRPAGVSVEQWEEYLILKDMRDLGAIDRIPSEPSAAPTSTNLALHISSTSSYPTNNEKSSYSGNSEEGQLYDGKGHWSSDHKSGGGGPSRSEKGTLATDPSHDLPPQYSPSVAPSQSSTFRSSTSTQPETQTSPFAHTPDWSPTAQDSEMYHLPQQPITARIKQRFARTAGDIFNPPCPSFSRHAPSLPPASFPPYTVSGKGTLMGDGFKPHYPSNLLAPRNVSAADWARYLEDIEVAGRLTGAQSVVSNVAPITMHLGAAGYFVTKKIEKGMRRKKEPAVDEAMQIWQNRSHGPRGLLVQAEMKDRTVHRTTSSSSSSSSDSEEERGQHTSYVGLDRRAVKDLRRARKHERRERRKDEKADRKREREERKQTRRDKRGADDAWLLVISPLAQSRLL